MSPIHEKFAFVAVALLPLTPGMATKSPQKLTLADLSGKAGCATWCWGC